MECGHCGYLFQDEDSPIQTQDGEVCQSCADEHYSSCEHCGELFLTDSNDALYINDSFFCGNRCAGRAGYIQCYDCSEWVNSDDAVYINNQGSVCNNCSNEYSYCYGCNEYFREGQVNYCDEEDQYFCDNCYPEADENGRLIHDYGYKPEPDFHKMKWENTLYLGVEFEFEMKSGGSISTATEELKSWLVKRKVDSMCYFKEDGSLNNGVEIVFHPFTLQAIHKKFPMRDFISEVKRVGLHGYIGGHCGIHVHLSKKHFKQGKHISADGQKDNMLGVYIGKIFFFKCKEYIARFSARGSLSSDEGRAFSYCKFSPRFPKYCYDAPNGRYDAINTSPMETVEVRVFRSTTDYRRIQASLQFCDAFANFCNFTTKDFVTKENPAIIWQAFLDYCKKTGRYSHFIKYILRKGII